MKVQCESLVRDGLKLALKSWIPDSPRAVLIYIHGVQSHGGWLFETGPGLSQRGIATFVMDRRGCGLSEGVRGDVNHFMEWIEDYSACVNYVRSLYANIPLTILGQSMGGSLLAGFVKRIGSPFDSLIFCAPAINQRISLPQARQKEILEQEIRIQSQPELGLTEIVVPIDDDQYTRDPKYLEFIRNDKLMTRKVTLRSSLERWNMEKDYLSSGNKWPDVKTAFVFPRQDRIIHLDPAREALVKWTGNRLVSYGLNVDDHFIEFSQGREEYLDFVAQFAITSPIQRLG